MKRISPKTGLPFKKGEVREDGMVFYQYRKIIRLQTGYYAEYWLTADKFKQHNFVGRSGEERDILTVARNLYRGAVNRCKGCPSRTKAGRPPTNGKITITKEWILERIKKGICEATGEKLTIKPRKPNTVSLDRIDSNNPDYTPENCRIVTWQFNNMRGAYSDKEFIRVAKQLEITRKKSASSVSIIDNRESKNTSEHRASTSAGPWKNSNDANDYRGAVSGPNAYRSAKEGSGNSLATRNNQVEPSPKITRIENYGDGEAEIIRLDFSRRHLSD